MADDHLEIQNLSRECNELLILASLAVGKRHGYEIGLFVEERSDGQFRFNHGTLYPILHRLEKRGHIRGGWSRQGPERQRKYYTLTARGRRHAHASVEQWKKFNHRMSEITRELES